MYTRAARSRGFTLIELLVVMAIGSLLVGVAPPAFDRLQAASQYRDTVRGLVNGLRQTRLKAIQQGQPMAFTIDLAAKQFGPEGAAAQKIPASVALITTVGSREGQSADTQARIVFLPDGGSTGGVVDVVRSTGQGTRIRVDWLMGQISQEPRTP